MEQVLSFLSQPIVIYAILAILILFILFLIFIRITRKKQLKKLHKLEVDINSMRSIPISFKLNKALGLSKVNEEVSEKVVKVQQEYADVTQELDKLTKLLGDAEDDIHTHKVKSSKNMIDQTMELFHTTSLKVQDIEKELDGLLQDEIRLRDNINGLKDKNHLIKQDYHQKLSLIPLSEAAIDEKFSEIENQFNSFEEWMFASEFSNANDDYLGIKEKLNFLEQTLSSIVETTKFTTQIVPSQIENITKLYETTSTKGVFLGHLEVLSNLNIINETLKEDEINLKNLKLELIDQNNQESLTRISQLTTLIEKEDEAFESVNAMKDSVFGLKQTITSELESFNTSLRESSSRFGFYDLLEKAPAFIEKNSELEQVSNQLFHKLNNEKLPYSSLLNELVEFNTDLKLLQSNIQTSNQIIYTARSDETRANQQVLKLNLLMNDVSVKIRQRNLPHISETYRGDVLKASTLINQVSVILAHNPLNLPLLNSNLQETIDFVYRLYNNVNNLAGTVDMVENAIVYANKYRSTSQELDSELTKAEVSFRNGEYTYALTTVIHAIEKFKPGAQYEELILQNAQSANHAVS